MDNKRFLLDIAQHCSKCPHTRTYARFPLRRIHFLRLTSKIFYENDSPRDVAGAHMRARLIKFLSLLLGQSFSTQYISVSYLSYQVVGVGYEIRANLALLKRLKRMMASKNVQGFHRNDKMSKFTPQRHKNTENHERFCRKRDRDHILHIFGRFPNWADPLFP